MWLLSVLGRPRPRPWPCPWPWTRNVSTSSSLFRAPNPTWSSGQHVLRLVCNDMVRAGPDQFAHLKKQIEEEELKLPPAESAPAQSSSPQAAMIPSVLSELLASAASSPLGVAVGVAYGLHKENRIELSNEFAMKVLERHMPLMSKMSPLELSSTCLLLYLGGPWQSEHIFNLLDPTATQKRVAELLRAKQLSSAQICAICMGLKKISGFSIVLPDLRDELYAHLTTLGHKEAFDEADNAALIQMCVLLSRGSPLFRDLSTNIRQMVEAFSGSVSKLQLSAAVKIMSFGVSRYINVQEVTESVTKMILECPHALSLRDSVGVLNFFVRCLDLDRPSPSQSQAMQAICDEVSSIDDVGVSVQDVLDVLQCSAHLSWAGVFNEELTVRIVDAANAVADEDYANKQPEELSISLLSSLFPRLFPSSFEKADPDLRLSAAASTSCCRAVAVLAFNALMFGPTSLQSAAKLKPAAIESLVALCQSPVPLQAHSPHLSSKELSLGQRMIVDLCRLLTKHVHDGAEGYSVLAHLWPTLRHPEVVCGHLAGIWIHVPSRLLEGTGFEPKKAPEVGEWFVFMSKNRDDKQLRYTADLSASLKRRLLRRLGFTLVEIDLDLSTKSVTGIVKWAECVAAGKYTQNE